MGLSLIVGALSARYLGPSNYGLIGYGASLVNLFTSISQLGLDSVVMNTMVKHPEEKGRIMGTAICMRLVASFVSLICVMILVMLIDPGEYVLWAIVALQAFSIMCRTYEQMNDWFRMELKSKYYVIANVCGQTVVGVWKITLLVVGASVLWFGASTTVQALVCGAIVTVCFLKDKNFKLGFSVETAKYLFSRGKHYVLANIAIALYTQMDKVMINKMMGNAEVGYYTAAMTIAQLWEFIPIAMIQSAEALILKTRAVSGKTYMDRLKLLLFAINCMGIGVGIGIQLLGWLAVRILYGEEYMAAVPVLSLLVWSTTFAVIGVARNIWSIAEGYDKYSKNYTLCGAAFNLVFNALAIPVWGVMGAALGTLLAQIVVSLISPLFWKETRPFLGIYLDSWRVGFIYVKNVVHKLRTKQGGQ